MGISAHRQRDFSRARALYESYLEIGRELGSSFHVSNVLAQFGTLAVSEGQPERGARLISAAAVFHEAARTRPIPLTEALVAEGIQQARLALGDAGYANAVAAGRTMSSEAAIAEALAVHVSASQPGDTEARQSSPLTEREQQVALLVARGLTNRQIAAELVVADRTVASHIEHILDKLGFGSRTQIGVWAAARAHELSHPADPG